MELPTARYTGISAASRRQLEQLHRAGRDLFTPTDAARVLKTTPLAAARLLARWRAQGWVRRLRRGVYVLVPLGAAGRTGTVSDPWVVLAHVFRPGYIGGWSACEHWEFTEQIFREVVVFTTKPIRPRRGEIDGAPYLARVMAPNRLFGTRRVWRDRTPVEVSDPSRTIIDVLDIPSLGGGIRHVADIVREYFKSSHRDDARLVDYAQRLGNQSVFKRLGYLIERLEIDADEISQTCRRSVSAGYTRLDPAAGRRGPLLRRWRLQINVEIPVNR
jgi:predicted transcriptional regulator of viral defense system